ncbi:hypothetical protein [Vibrio fluvialis]|uniref:hypothetical protein n=1 Tax=Vibrio fluvialis TaxID=676 RepID=UPI001C9C2857|nr:hypothetical protein [Vibrio fluvialis]MBY8132146.1 hypothetical protein [Vibrio fluvialis]
MKMIDVFVSQTGLLTVGNIRKDIYQDIDLNMIDVVGSFKTVEHARCAAHAIENHDRLTSENERLREMVKAAYIEGSKSGYSDGLSDGQSWSSNKSSSNPNGDWEYSDAKQRLTELEKGGENNG